ncbi:MAG TPA: hypothetical protein VIM41_12200 [Gammaproteobacteria bacterium]
MYKYIYDFYLANYLVAIKAFLKTSIVALLLGALYSTAAIAVDDAYVKALEVEAKRSAQLNDNDGKKSVSSVNGAAQSKQILPVENQELQQFELELKTSWPATYRFYKKLDPQDQSKVLTVYKEDNKMTKVNKTVFNLYFEKNK